jgi:hypothetical protein
MEDTANPTQHTDSEPEVQEIDPPVIARSTRTKHHRNILREPIDWCFCCCSQRNKKRDEHVVNTPDLAVLTQTSSDPNFTSLTNSAAAIR